MIHDAYARASPRYGVLMDQTQDTAALRTAMTGAHRQLALLGVMIEDLAAERGDIMLALYEGGVSFASLASDLKITRARAWQLIDTARRRRKAEQDAQAPSPRQQLGSAAYRSRETS